MKSNAGLWLGAAVLVWVAACWLGLGYAAMEVWKWLNR